ncbi:MAG: hypothetical protein ABH856_02820 [Patescibacteria group bacterium]
MPNFYCPDTLKIIKEYLNVKFYKINDDFTLNKDDYFEQIRKHNPRVILNYTFLGFSLNKAEQEKLDSLCGESTIIIEDYAHRIIDKSKIIQSSKNRLYVDSVRKHRSLLGSHIFSDNFSYKKNTVEKMNSYKIRCGLLQTSRNLLELASLIFRSPKLYVLSEKIFLRLDKVIGSKSPKPTLGSFYSYHMYNLLDAEKIKKHKKELALYYNSKLKEIKSPIVTVLEDKLIQSSELCYYPVIVNKNHIDALIEYLSLHGIYADKLWDPNDLDFESYEHANKKLFESLVILPLSWSVKKTDVDFMSDTIIKFLK